MHEVLTKTVAKINEVDILVIENGEQRVAIRPICEALGVSTQAQLDRIKEDPILGSTIMLSITVGADGKKREMQTIPFKYAFGWLFRIDSRNVKEEAREAVLKYQIECYNVLYDYFVGAKKFLELKEKETERFIQELKAANKNYFTAKELKRGAEKKLEELSKFTYQQFLENNRQLKLPFENLEEGKNE